MRFYKPKLWIAVLDVFIVLVSVVLIFLILPFTVQNPFIKYSIPVTFYIIFWIIISYVLGRYRNKRSIPFFTEILNIFYTSLTVTVIFALSIWIQKASPYSPYVLIVVSLVIFILQYVIDIIYYSYRYAVGYDAIELNPEKRKNAIEAVSSINLSNDAILERKYRIVEKYGDKVYSFLLKNSNLNFKNTLILNDFSVEELEKIGIYSYSTIVQLKRLNRIRGINKLLGIVNEKLPDDAIFICCYKSKSTNKKQYFNNQNRVKATVFYCFNFLYYRVLPKLFITQRLFYDITGGKNRILSKTEVLGRLSYCGFEPLKQVKIGYNNYIIAKRIRNTEPIVAKYYGALIKLKRTGKKGKLFNVYKFRTMHPYSEYIQSYIYKTSSLAEGGKFKRDIRVTTLGRFMRKYWLDELPMLLNVIKGEMKIVGVRPLSKQYFSLYSEELQAKRIKYKPGLLPPFYADMPKTLDEIQESEMKYLNLCEKNGVIVTDIKYFFTILKNIFFKKARSA